MSKAELSRGRVIGLQERPLGRTVLRTYRTKVDIDDVIPNDRQPRLGPKEDEELQRQIDDNEGLFEPLLVEPHPDIGGKYRIIDGERRWTNSQALVAQGKNQYRQVPVEITDRTLSDEERLRVWIYIHRQRKEWDAKEKEMVAYRLVELVGRASASNILGVSLRDRFGNDGKQFTRARLRELERKPNDALHSRSRHHRHVLCDLDRKPPVSPAPDARILTLGIFANDHPIQFWTGDMPQRAFDTRQNPRRTDVCILVEGLTDRQPKPPQGDMVRDVRRTHGAEQNSIELSELLGAIRRHHNPVLLVVIGSPIKILEVQLEAAVAFSTNLERFDRGVDYLGPDPVSAHGGDIVCLHSSLP